MHILAWPSTPLGPLWAEVNPRGQITALHWGTPPASAQPAEHPLLHKLMEKYFAGERKTFPAHLFAPSGTPFQQRVWQALLEIPYGQTVSYQALAEKLGTAPRAIGGAVGANPIPILIPCHRVMGKNGSLTGFSAPGGLTTKTWLLAHEGITHAA